jgi:hypothetical protein
VRPPPVVALVGGPAFFLEQALGALREGGRVEAGVPGTSDVLFSVGGEGLDDRGPGLTSVITPSADPTLLPALNRRLAQAGLAWRVERTPAQGEAMVGENRLPVDLSGVRVQQRYTVHGGTPSEILVRLNTAEPWMLQGTTLSGTYVLLASPLEPDATSLPVSVSMVPLLEWMTSLGAEPTTARGVEAGQPIRTPSGATHVQAPDGTLHPVDGTHAFPDTRQTGIYTLLRGDSVLQHIAVSAPVRESALARLTTAEIRTRAGQGARVADDAGSWRSSIFVSSQGPELWWPLLAAALALLLLEGWMAAPGRTASPRARPLPLDPQDDPQEIGATVTK